jgi:hypothetical protein
MRIPTVLALVAGLTLGAAAPAQAADSTGLVAFLAGTSELPAGSGDADASGVVLASIKPGSGRICYVIRVRKVDGTVTGAHLHAGRTGEEGAAVAHLDPPTASGAVAACTWIGKKLAGKIRKAPHKYYVNVHSTAFPDGALRGQLQKG